MSSEETILDKSWNKVASSYHLFKVLGAGTSGLVVRAQSKTSGQRVAIKQLRNFCRSEVTAIRALREISILNFLKEHSKAAKGHFPFTVVHEVLLHQRISLEGKAEVTAFIVMEEVPTTLKKVLENAEGQPLKDKTVAKIVYQLLCAVRFLHKAGIGHRDLKPANILVDKHYNIKISDFGLSRSCMGSRADHFSSMDEQQISDILVEDRAQRQRKSRRLSGRVITREYRPPEIILLEKEYDTRADLWSLGCILTELFPNTTHYKKRDLHPQLMFRGTCCHPLSPSSPSTNIRKGEDQLEAIIKEVGTLSSTDTSFLTSEDTVDYVLERATPKKTPMRWKKKFCLTDPALIEMAEQLLKFNFYYRAEAEDLLRLPFFFQIGERLDIETAEPGALELPVDAPGAYDYKENRSCLKMKEIVGFLREAARATC